MIIIYDSLTTDFDNNGIAVLTDTLKCEVTELLNNNYDLDLEYPLDSQCKWQYIVEGNILKCPTPAGEQLFRIFNKTKTLNTIRCKARHIFYDLKDNFLEDVRPTQTSGAGALDWILTHTQYPHNYIGMSDISTVNTAYYVRKNPIQALLSGDENSFINKWGGELVRDNFTIKMLQQSGQDRGVLISYGKNLTGIEEDLNLDNVVTRIMPTGVNSDDTILILPEKYIDSPYVYNYSQPKIQEIHFQDIKVSENLTIEQAYELLRQKVSDLYIKQKVDIPFANYKVSFVELSKTEEYKNYKVLETVYLGDIVTIRHTKLNIDIKAKVIKYRYDVISQKYIEIELGDFKPNTTDQQRAVNNLLNALSQTMVSNKSDLQKAIDNATQLLTTALGGYVVKKENEILIMDTQDINTATKVWRWNLNGLGYSKTGYNGNFALAMTMDGAIVADFITTGVLNASLIKAGIITSKNGKLSINLDDDTMTISGTSKWMGANGYITIDGDDLVQVIGDTKTPFYRLNDIIKTSVPAYSGAGSGMSYVWVDLPSKYKNKNFKINLSIYKITTNNVPSTFGIVSNMWMDIFDVDYINAKVYIGALLYIYDITNQDFYTKNEDLGINIHITA